MNGQLTAQVSDMQALYGDIYYLYRHRYGQNFKDHLVQLLQNVSKKASRLPQSREVRG